MRFFLSLFLALVASVMAEVPTLDTSKVGMVSNNVELARKPDMDMQADGSMTDKPADMAEGATIAYALGGKKALTAFVLFPTPSPNVLAGLLAGLFWLTIFFLGFCALYGVEGPSKFVEKGLLMTKEY